VRFRKRRDAPTEFRNDPMTTSIQRKIFWLVSAILLVFGIAVGGYLYSDSRIAKEVDGVFSYHIPIYNNVASIDIRTYAAELELRRLNSEMRERRSIDPGRLAASRERWKESLDRLQEHFRVASIAFAAAIEDPSTDLETRLKFAELSGKLDQLRNSLPGFVSLTEQVAAAFEMNDPATAERLMPQFRQYENQFGPDLTDIRHDLREVVARSTETIRGRRQATLFAGVALLLIAAGLGLFLARRMSGRIVSGLQVLLGGVRKVQQGDFSQTLPAAGSDEVGELTTAFNFMLAGLREKEKIKDTFGKYMDPRLVADVIGSTENQADRRSVTVLFSDIQGFSRMSEALTAQAMVKLLNAYFSGVADVIQGAHGIIDKYIGDAVMAFWAAPFCEGDTHASQACLAALAQQQTIERFRIQLPDLLGLRRDVPDFVVRMGLASGDAVLGTIGAERAKSYTVIGDTVNLASRLEGANKVYGTRILVSEVTYQLAKNDVEFREIDEIVAAGMTESVRIFEVMAARGQLTPEQLELRDAYAEGRSAFRQQDWDAAAGHFRRCLEVAPCDEPSKVFLRRIDDLRLAPPPNKWDGVRKLVAK
jgi:adenylate cyclase